MLVQGAGEDLFAGAGLSQQQNRYASSKSLVGVSQLLVEQRIAALGRGRTGEPRGCRGRFAHSGFDQLAVQFGTVGEDQLLRHWSSVQQVVGIEQMFKREVLVVVAVEPQQPLGSAVGAADAAVGGHRQQALQRGAEQVRVVLQREYPAVAQAREQAILNRHGGMVELF
ncbi:hypothetical protein D3C84_757070 [compost metagenome]